MSINSIQNTFTAGELSPLMRARNDYQRYYNGAEKLTNWIVLPQGGATKTPGTSKVAEVKVSAKKTRLIPFQYSTVMGYLIELGDEYMRFYFRGGGQVLHPEGHESAGDPVEIASPYKEDEIFDVQFAQDADLMYLTHRNHKPRKLSRTAPEAFELNNYTPTEDPFTTADNYPRAVTIFQRRLWFAGTNNKTQTIWGSQIADYDNMDTGTALDDEAVEFKLGSTQVNSILWLTSGQYLFGGTTGGVFKMTGGVDDPITPDNVQANRDTAYGVQNIQPEMIGERVFYVQRNDKTIREFGYTFEEDRHVAQESTVDAEHLTQKGIAQLGYQQSPHDILWAVTNDGNIATLTRQVEHEVLGWTKQETDGDYESVACISGDGEDDEVWFIVNRTIGGNTKRYVERLDPFSFESIDEARYVHSGASYDEPKTITASSEGTFTTDEEHGFSVNDTVIFRDTDTDLDYVKFTVTAVTSTTFDVDTEIESSTGQVRKCVETITELNYLEGKEVAVLTDGAVHPKQTVSSGQISLDWKAGLVRVGLPYDSELKTNRLEFPGQMPLTGLKKKSFEATVRLYNTVGAIIGDTERQDEIWFREIEQQTDTAIPLFSGDKTLTFPGTWDLDGYIIVKSQDPLPITVLSIVRKVEVTM